MLLNDLGDHFRFVVDADPCDAPTLSKSGKFDSETRWVRGVASTEELDEDDEEVLQRGLDVSYFGSAGWFNYDHDAHDIIGVPVAARVTYKGFHCEGFLLRGIPNAERTWAISQALAKSGTDRRLGMSIEGKVLERDPENPTRIVRARVYNVALTPHPINVGARFDTFAKSMRRGDADAYKALTAGYGTSPQTQTGGGALREESLNEDVKDPLPLRPDLEARCAKLTGARREACLRALRKKSMTRDDVATVLQLLHGLSQAHAHAVVFASCS